MTLSQTIATFEALGSPRANGETVAALLRPYSATSVRIETVRGPRGSTDFVRIEVPGRTGRRAGGSAPTLGVVGRLGGLGARPGRVGLVSDADGGVAAVATALKLAQMHDAGDVLTGDVILATHVCPDAPTRRHDPVDFMDSPVRLEQMNGLEVDPAMDAVLAIDTTKANRILSHRGIAISPCVKAGWILRVPDDLLRLLEITSGEPAVTFPITMQDITPYGNGVFHINSILQPSIATESPVVGVAVGATTVVPGSATGASREVDIAGAVRFAVEVAKAFTAGTCRFHDQAEYERLVALYGDMRHLQRPVAGADGAVAR